MTSPATLALTLKTWLSTSHPPLEVWSVYGASATSVAGDVILPLLRAIRHS
jgi:hypothetical protein